MAETMLQQRIDFILPGTVKEKILTLEGPACNVTTGDSGIIYRNVAFFHGKKTPQEKGGKTRGVMIIRR